MENSIGLGPAGEAGQTVQASSVSGYLVNIFTRLSGRWTHLLSNRLDSEEPNKNKLLN